MRLTKLGDSLLIASKKEKTLAKAKIFLKVGGNEKNGGSGRSQMLDNGLGPWRSRFIFNLNMQFLR